MNRRININKTAFTAVSLNLIQIGVLIVIVLYTFLARNKSSLIFRYSSEYLLFFILLILTAVLNSYISIKNRYMLNRDDSQFQILQDAFTRLESLNNSLRAQRHDFMNHLQVVYSLMEMDEYTDARDYIEKVYKDIQKVSRVLKTSNPAINALLQAKMLDCEKRGITVRLNVTSPFKDLKVPAWEMCRVLGNLIDNSMEALEEVHDEKYIDIELFEDIKSHAFLVRNNGPMIPGNLYEKIFEPRFTTKPGKGEGMGLAITQDILSGYGGKITVSSNEKNTVFEGVIPK